MRRRVRLTESDLHTIIRETVKRVLNEGYYGDKPRNDEFLEMAMDDAKRFLRDYGGDYKNYGGPSVSLSGDYNSETICRHAYDLYNNLKYQKCKDKKLMKAMEHFLNYYGML